jgi:hypothetical protein
MADDFTKTVKDEIDYRHYYPARIWLIRVLYMRYWRIIQGIGGQAYEFIR